MKTLLISIATIITIISIDPAHANTTMVCQTAAGQQFVWVGTGCPPGSFFVSY